MSAIFYLLKVPVISHVWKLPVKWKLIAEEGVVSVQLEKSFGLLLLLL